MSLPPKEGRKSPEHACPPRGPSVSPVVVESGFLASLDKESGSTLQHLAALSVTFSFRVDMAGVFLCLAGVLELLCAHYRHQEEWYDGSGGVTLYDGSGGVTLTSQGTARCPASCVREEDWGIKAKSCPA